MNCPNCNAKMKCVDSRGKVGAVYRRYKCNKCGQHASSYEVLGATPQTLTQEQIRDRLEHPWKYPRAGNGKTHEKGTAWLDYKPWERPHDKDGRFKKGQ